MLLLGDYFDFDLLKCMGAAEVQLPGQDALRTFLSKHLKEHRLAESVCGPPGIGCDESEG